MAKRDDVLIVLNEFRGAWNQKDLNQLSTFLRNDIINISPALNIGIIPIKAKATNGLHHFLKTTKEIWEQFDTYMDPLDMMNIIEKEDHLIIELLTHYPLMDITDINDLYLDNNLKFMKCYHKKITKYRAIENRAPFGSLLLKGLKNKAKRIFGKIFL